MSALKSSWKHFLLSNPEFETSNNFLAKIKELSDPAVLFDSSFEEISKNPGIAMISLDPSESSIQLFHHNQIIGGTWDNPSKLFVSICGFDKSVRPIQIVKKSLKVAKAKVPPFTEVMTSKLPDSLGTESKSTRRVEVLIKNLIPIPHSLTKTYLSLSEFDPLTVAKAFYDTMFEHDSLIQTKQDRNDEDIDTDETKNLESDNLSSKSSDDTSEASNPPSLVDDGKISTPITKNANETSVEQDIETENKLVVGEKFFPDFAIHLLQFFHLCFRKKMPPVQYSLDCNTTIDNWFNKIAASIKPQPTLAGSKRSNSLVIANTPDSENSSASPDQKISRKDKYFIHTMLKIHDTMDKTTKKNQIKSQALRDSKNIAKT